MPDAPTWGDAIVEGSLEWAFLDREDLPEIADLCAAIEYFDNPAQTRTLADMVIEFNEPGSHPHHHAVVGRDKGGTIVAYAWNHISADIAHPQVWIEIGVHPAWRHHKIGYKLVGWCIERARTWYRHLKESCSTIDSLWIGCAVDEHLRVAEDLRDDGQLEAQRWFFDAHRPLAEPPIPDIELAPNIELVPFTLDLSEQVRQAHNRAFSTRVGAENVDRESWDTSIQRSEFRPQWSWVARDRTDRDRVIGYALNCELNDSGWREGWTERIGVHPAYRSAKIGRALLCASMRSFAQAGCVVAGIGIDTDAPVQASTLFTRLDYVLDDRMVLFAARFLD